MKIILTHEILNDVLFLMDDGSKRWYVDMTPSEKREANRLLRLLWVGVEEVEREPAPLEVSHEI